MPCASHSCRAALTGRVRFDLVGIMLIIGLLSIFPRAAAALPDGRAYEFVSPPDKNGGGVMLSSSRVRAAADGSALQFASLVGFGDVHGTAISTEYIARRVPTGWSTHGITPQQEPMSGLFILNGPGDAVFEGEFSPNLARGVVRANAYPPTDPNVATVSNLFLRSDLLSPGRGNWHLVTESAVPIPPPWTGFTFPPPAEIVPATYKPYFAGASKNFDHIIFESILNLTQDTLDAALPRGEDDHKLYEWADGAVQYVGVLPEEEGGGLARAVAGQGASGIAPTYTADAISDDGSRIFFSTPASGRLYVREDGNRTTRIDAPEKVNPTSAPAVFRAATPDGSHVFFTTAAQLTEDDENGVADLYRANLDQPAGSRLTRLSVDGVLGDSYAPDVTGVLGVSDDGSRAYFVSRGPLVEGGLSVGLTTPVIYLWSGGRLTVVGTLADSLEERTTADPTWGISSKTSRVSPDGRSALFVSGSENQLEPNDHGQCGNEKCREVYVFQAADGKATCVSCNPNGSAATADSGFTVFTGVGGSRQSSHLNQPLSADGRFVFFHTRGPLLPRDQNTEFDVYEYDLSNDELHLISSGDAEGGDAYFLDASASGRDVFFATREQLVGGDVDEAYDVYDARVGGGFAEPVRALPECVGRACQGDATGALGPRPTSSRAFRGSGNVRAKGKKARKRCRRGKVRRRVEGRVRCVRVDRRGRVLGRKPRQVRWPGRGANVARAGR